MAQSRSHVHSIAPDAFVQFWAYTKERLVDPKTNNPVSADGSLMKVSEIVVRKDIISISTQKSKGSVGTFKITLSSNINWKKALTPGSWCFIHMSDRQLGGGEGTEPYGGLKMVGIVKAVRRAESIAPLTGHRMVRYEVSGEDFQTIFSAKVYISPEITEGDKNNAVSSLAVTGKQFLNTIGKGPAEIVNTLIDSIVGSAAVAIQTKGPDGSVTTSNVVSTFKAGFPILVPQEVFRKIHGTNSTEFSKMVSRCIYSPLIGKISSFIPSFSDQTELWSAIQTYSNAVLNETYCDLLPVNVNGKTRLIPSFVMRPIPFSTKPPAGTEHATIKYLSCLKKVKPVKPDQLGRDKADKEREKKESSVPVLTGSHYYVSRQIFEDEIMSFNTGKSDGERMNFFLVSGTIAGNVDAIAQIRKAGNINNMVNAASAKRHGLRPFIYTTNYDTLQQGDTTFATMTNIVKDLWQNGHLYENGFLTIVGIPNHIPVGSNILFAERGWMAHVESVSHEFNVSPDGIKNYRTNIAFTRLMNTDGSPIDEHEDGLKSGQLGPWDRSVTDVPTAGKSKKKGRK